MIYCLSCKKPTEDLNIKPKVTKNKRPPVLNFHNITNTNLILSMAQ